MSKYYYDDALQAAWMAREFDFEFWGDLPSQSKLVELIDYQHIASTKYSKYILKNKCTDVLQPKVGDYVKAYIKHGHGECVAASWITSINEHKLCRIHQEHYSWPISGLTIIERDNKRFFTPKETTEV